MLCVSRSLTAGSTRSTLLDWARPLHALSPRLQSAPKTGLGQAQRTWLVDKAFTVPSFGGSLWVDSALPVRISPIGSLEYPNLDRAFVRLTVPAQSGLTKDCAQVDVKQEGHKLTVKNQNVLVEPKDKSEAGAVSATRIKTGNLTIQTVAGDVLCSGHIQGECQGQVGEWDFIGDKRFTGRVGMRAIQPDKFSPSLLVIAENGDVIVDSQDWAASLGLKMPLMPDSQ
ncbi:hypothetical protein TCAL_16365 [Tigriopus californicus]|uniref:Uncharacterized protein n=1 Tax=Tigriopus californicus TaxID=6832 RepID=A0A553NZ67_TIGCA|nr:hypothetical protein TCAL_16365 [Tigriopus californicus]